VDWAQLGFAIASAIIVAAGVGIYIPRARATGLGQKVRKEGPAGHLKKEGTVTGAGVIFGIPVFAGGVWVLAKGGTTYLAPLLTILALGLMGWIDDRLKVYTGTRGLPARYRFVGQGILGFALGMWAYQQFGGAVHLPFGLGVYEMGLWRIGLDTFVVWGLANGVNFTDGLDGLLAGVFPLFGVGVIGMMLATAVTPLTPLVWAGVGASVGFLVWNVYPARAFMGEVGSSILAAIGAVAVVAAGLEMGLLIVGLIFAVEVFSVILQIFAFKVFKKRVFRMSPLHHHFELCGIREDRVTMGFWLAQTGLSLGGIMAYV
jgi:phospho-N-acetylmuramoyl-pentapeptide-transferase